MNSRIERRTPREDFLVAMFQDDPRLVEALKQKPVARFNVSLFIAMGAGAILWAAGITLVWLWRRGIL